MLSLEVTWPAAVTWKPHVRYSRHWPAHLPDGSSHEDFKILGDDSIWCLELPA